MKTNELTQKIIGSAIEVHRSLGPGLLESTYEECVARELDSRRIFFERQKAVPLLYKGSILDCTYRLDFLVEQIVVVEIKAIELILPIHRAQLLTYMRLGSWKIGLLINFHVPVLKQGIQRFVLDFRE